MFTSHPKSMKAAVDQACPRHAVNKHKRNSRYPANVAIVTTPPLQKNVRKKMYKYPRYSLEMNLDEFHLPQFCLVLFN